jgi:hypothetical protein
MNLNNVDQMRSTVNIIHVYLTCNDLRVNNYVQTAMWELTSQNRVQLPCLPRAVRYALHHAYLLRNIYVIPHSRAAVGPTEFMHFLWLCVCLGARFHAWRFHDSYLYLQR